MERALIEKLLIDKARSIRELRARAENKRYADIFSNSLRVIDALIDDIDRHTECLCPYCGQGSGVIGRDSTCDQCKECEQREFEAHHQDSDDRYGSRPGED